MNAAASVAQSVEHPSKVQVWCNSTDVDLIPGHSIGVRKNPSHAIYEANIEVRKKIREEIWY